MSVFSRVQSEVRDWSDHAEPPEIHRWIDRYDQTGTAARVPRPLSKNDDNGASPRGISRSVDQTILLRYPEPMKVSAQYAETHFADLLSAASNGQEVEIELPNKPALFLAPRPAEHVAKPPRRPRRELFGAGEGLVTLPTDEEWRAMDKEIEDDMLNGPIFPPESD